MHKRRQRLKNNYHASGNLTEKCLQLITKACGGVGVLRGALNSGPVSGKLWRPQEEVVSKASGGTLWEENRASVVTERKRESLAEGTTSESHPLASPTLTGQWLW